MFVLQTNTYWGRPAKPVGRTGVLVLAGSSGRIDTARVDMLASRGVVALGVKWFGGEGLPRVPRDVPLEYFSGAMDLLQRECDRIVVIGLSYGAEAALLSSSCDTRPVGVVAIAPTDVAWEGDVDQGDDEVRSKWTYGGRPVPFVPLDRTWSSPCAEPAFVDYYMQSRRAAGPEIVATAEIPVEKIRGEVLLVAGGDDKVWPSLFASRRMAARRAVPGLVTTVVHDDQAGHPVALPGEPSRDSRREYRVGGDRGSPQRLGAKAWPHIARMLSIGP